MSMTHPDSPPTHIGPFLRHVRTSLGLNLRDAAKAAGVSFTYLGQVERGERAPSDSWLRAYIEHLGTVAADRDASAA